ncbi:MAG TPA: hypothetical protein VFA11_02155 [Acidimicrobiales bacterium]|nr:hypothetical protein [Acidimicrobiales bacterium]
MDDRPSAPQAVALHVTFGTLILAFLGLAWWQVDRALSGNTLSWVYAFEWPFFAGYAVYMWRKLLADTRGEGAGPPPADEARAARQRQEEEELASYNRYLAELNASGRRKTWRTPT